MSYVPHSPDDVRRMLDVIGVESVEDLFAQIPQEYRLDRPLDLPPPLSEWETARELTGKAAANAAKRSLRASSWRSPWRGDTAGSMRLAGRASRGAHGRRRAVSGGRRSGVARAAGALMPVTPTSDPDVPSDRETPRTTPRGTPVPLLSR